MGREEELELDATPMSAHGSSRSQILLTHLEASSKISQQRFWHIFAKIYSLVKFMRPAAYTGHTRQISDEDLRIFAQSTNLIPKRTNRFRGSQNITQRMTGYLANCDIDIKGMISGELFRKLHEFRP
jgi:hypothetical protein